MNEIKQKNGFGITGLILGILGLLLAIVPYFAIFVSILGIIFSAKQMKKNNNGIAISGLVTSIIGVCVNVIMLLLVVFYLWTISNLGYYPY